MTANTVILRSLRHYWRTHLGVILGAALATLVLTGALLVGDSVKATLRVQAEARVGKVGEALLCGERFVAWPRDVAKRPAVVARMFYPGADAAGVLLMQGVAAKPDGSARANRVQIVGVDDAFWKLSPSAGAVPLGEGEIALNGRLAQQLGVAAGAELVLRLEKPGAFSKDAPLSGEEDDVVSLRVRVARVVGDADFGRFALTSGQVPPFTAFVPLAALQEKAGLGEKVNVVLDAVHVWENPDDGSMRGAWLRFLENIGYVEPYKFGTRRDTFNEESRRADAQKAAIMSGGALASFDARIEPLANGGFELRTPRVFLDAPIIAAARANEKASQSDPFVQFLNPKSQILNPPPPGLDSLTYFVNELRLGDGSDSAAPATPYSMVTAIDAPSSGFVQAELADDEIQLTRWTADDLGAKPGDRVTIKYFAMGERRQLVEKARTFTVLAPIIEMEEPRLDASWMPDFPGLAGTESCRDWKPGFDFHPERMRDKDQDYWTKYKGTPKAFINLKTGQEMWGNRWGNLTSIRYPAATKREQVERIAAFIDPAALGFRVANLRADALAATDAPVDFGQLFVSFSFFLIAAAAVLTGLLFTFSIEQRAAEAGLLLAIGWRRRQVRRLFIKEGALLACIGSLGGAALAALYTKGVLAALAGVWSGATGGTAFVFAPGGATFGIGIASGIIVALLAMWLASRRLFKKEAGALLSGETSGESVAGFGKSAATSGKVRSNSAGSLATSGGSLAGSAGSHQTSDEYRLNSAENRSNSAGEPLKSAGLQSKSAENRLNSGKVYSQTNEIEGGLVETQEKASASDQNAPEAGQLSGIAHNSNPTPAEADGSGAAPKGGTRPMVPHGGPSPLRQAGPWYHPANLVIWTLVGFSIVGGLNLLVAKWTFSPLAFFGLGFTLLLLGVWWARRILIRASFSTAMKTGSDLALRNTTRRRGRSLATIAVLASGVFMVVAVDSFRKDTAADATRRDSGTGGFALVGESASPIYEDLNSEKGREQYALDEQLMAGVRVVQMRVRDGDDASCLNLNRAVQPRVIGVTSKDLAGRFGVSTDEKRRDVKGWESIANTMVAAAQSNDEAYREIPAIVDANTLQWALQKKVGNALKYTSDGGREFDMEIAGSMPASILQGSVFVEERFFIYKFPNEAGYRFFLVDAPPDKAQAVREHLTKQLGDRGLELISTAQRLAEFNAVENTYLSIFQVLGGLGMLLGSAGLGIVVARNVLERRREFGLLEAVGFTPRQLRALVFAEHRWLIAGALVIGAVSALVAVWPQLSQKGGAFPWAQLALLFGGVAAIGIACAWAATRLALRGSQLGALRSE